MDEAKMYQVSTLQALMQGYTRPVIKVRELLEHGEIGLGTFEGVDGEMIVLDGCCYCATENGVVVPAEDEWGVPFSSVCHLRNVRSMALSAISGIDQMKRELNNFLDENFALNSMHMARMDGHFRFVDARSVSPYRSAHVTLKTILDKNQHTFRFEEIEGTLVGVYYPDYMDGINAAGWHVHFLSSDCAKGGHVLDVDMAEGRCSITKIDAIELRLPSDPAFDTYALADVTEEEVQEVEQ